jgi:cell division protein FtsB
MQKSGGPGRKGPGVRPELARSAGRPAGSAGRLAGSTGRPAGSAERPAGFAGRPVGFAGRPATGRRPVATAAGGRPARRTPAPRPRRRTGRTTVLATILLALLLAYAYPMRVYLTQQAEIQALEDKQRAQRLHIKELEEERAKWDDDEYLRAQARRRLHYVLPGETAYLVLDDQSTPDGPGTAPGAGTGKGPNRWYDGLWSSIAVANR